MPVADEWQAYRWYPARRSPAAWGRVEGLLEQEGAPPAIDHRRWQFPPVIGPSALGLAGPLERMTVRAKPLSADGEQDVLPKNDVGSIVTSFPWDGKL